jgi:predicted ATP-grasp superfamily ATP-dependent carboligase
MTDTLPVVLLDSNIRAIEGVLYSFGSRGIPVIALSSEKNPPAFHSKYVTRKYVSPPVQEEQALLDFLLNLEEKGVLLYSDDAATSFTSRNLEKLKVAGYLINVPDYQKLMRGFDKAELAKAAAECEVPVIPTVAVREFSDLQQAWQELDKPLILKPTRLAGGKFTVIRQEDELEPAFQKMKALVESPRFRHLQSGLIAQEFISYGYDDIYCCESYYTRESKPIGFLSIHKIRPNINTDGTAGGRLYAGETEKNPELENFTRKLLDHLQWTGLAHLDWLYSKKYNQYLLCEINPRLPGFSNLVTKLNFDMAYYYYADLTGREIPGFKYKDALYFEALRMPGDVTGGLFAVSKGYISFSSLWKSYLGIFKAGRPVYLDVLYRSDPMFTLVSWKNFLLHFLKRPFKK